MKKLEEKVNEEDTREAPKEGYLTVYIQKDCKKKKYSKEYFLCKEPEKGFRCVDAIKVGQKYVCLRPTKK